MSNIVAPRGDGWVQSGRRDSRSPSSMS